MTDIIEMALVNAVNMRDVKTFQETLDLVKDSQNRGNHLDESWFSGDFFRDIFRNFTNIDLTKFLDCLSDGMFLHNPRDRRVLYCAMSCDRIDVLQYCRARFGVDILRTSLHYYHTLNHTSKKIQTLDYFVSELGAEILLDRLYSRTLLPIFFCNDYVGRALFYEQANTITNWVVEHPPLLTKFDELQQSKIVEILRVRDTEALSVLYENSSGLLHVVTKILLRERT